LQLLPGTSRTVFQASLVTLCALAIWGFARLIRSSMGAALQAGRDAPLRAMASGLHVSTLNNRIFWLSAALAGLSGSLWAISKGAVFPSVASVGNSVDALMMVLLGGVHHLLGALAGSSFLVGLGAEMGRHFDYWRGFLGVLIMALMVFAPEGVLGWQKQTAQLKAKAKGPST
jgi:branched-chain amino acid transport system permease protein